MQDKCLCYLFKTKMKKCKKEFKNIGGVCVRKRGILKYSNFKSFPNKLITIILSTLVVGFVWLAVLGFVGIPLLYNLTPLWKIIIGVIGVIIISGVSYALFGLSTKKLKNSI